METTLKQEIEKTVDFFAITDLKNEGQISGSTLEIARVQEVIPEARVYRARDGWSAKNTVKLNGVTWSVTTSKGYNGKINCSAWEVNEESREGGVVITSIDVFGCDKLSLATETGKATENKIREIHEAGLKELYKRHAEGLLPTAPEPLQPGQVIFLEGYEGGIKWVYEVVGTTLKTVDPSKLILSSHEATGVKPIEKIFGIGWYYRQDEKVSLEEVNQAVNDARSAMEERESAEEKASQAAAIERAEKLERGKEIISEIPEWAQSIIIAEHEVNESDSQSDYFGSRTDKTVYLAFSAHEKNLFPEMRKAAGLFEGTKELAEAGPEVEHRDNYSMGAGMYLGKSRYSGWNVKKRRLSKNSEYGINLQELQIAAAEGLFLCSLEQTKSENEPEFEKAEVKPGTVQIIDYSERAFAVIGDTKPIKDTLKALGGKFNFRLTCGAGWIFSKSRLDAVQSALQTKSAE